VAEGADLVVCRRPFFYGGWAMGTPTARRKTLRLGGHDASALSLACDVRAPKGNAMQVQVETDNHVEGREKLIEHVEGVIRDAVDRYEDPGGARRGAPGRRQQRREVGHLRHALHVRGASGWTEKHRDQAFDGPLSNRCYGRLNLQSDALLAHPAGYLISINSANDRFEVLRPPATAVTDKVAGENLIAQVMGGSGNLPGKLSNVTAATITKDGSLLLLERGNNRIQALDIGSNPVRYFGTTAKTYFLHLTEMPTSAGWQHLDIQADIGGLLYVLSTNTQTGVYRLSIYDSLSHLQQALSVTEGILAARFGLDHWRELYTLNYQPITVQSSGAKPAITEPSVSLWTPQAG
jgi:hypothetical protein